MIMKVEDFDDERLDGLHLTRVGQHLAYYMQQAVQSLQRVLVRAS
jgi:hypothetical protein